MTLSADADAQLESGDGAAVIGAIESVLREETDRLRRRDSFDVEASNHRKSRLLLLLMRLSAKASPDERESMVQKLGDLKELIGENMVCIADHQKALQEVSELMTNLLRSENDDGTYGEDVWK